MKFKGTIVITDPCYIIREENELTENDWHFCECGQCMEILGIEHYITESTLYGDWSCTTYLTEDPKKAVKDLAAINKYFNDQYESLGGYKGIKDKQYKKLCSECDKKRKSLKLKVEVLGHFCADAGLVSVFLLDEILKYNPDFEDWALCRPWCATIIKDFDGDIEYVVDKERDAHIIGTGSINFFTTQTGL